MSTIKDEIVYDERYVKCLHATPKAILVLRKGKEVWIPQSAIHEDSEVYKKGDEGKLLVKMWWAEKEGWI